MPKSRFRGNTVAPRHNGRSNSHRVLPPPSGPTKITKSLPAFRYHPDPLATGSVIRSDARCVCCGDARGYVYAGSAQAASPFVMKLRNLREVHPRGRHSP
ncbi:CbrC family protein [Burkholderia pyrrocinia]|uniref:CbrC family protein n=1 Tax=Burkholderia pyrrocinia TaxID=60550 RepID=UPI00237876F6|nr:CbrC family protein [Burkholderia pyrrocinia]